MTNHRRILWILPVVAALVGMVSPAAALTINLTYDDNVLDPASSGAFNPAEKAVILQAVNQWQNSITSAGAVNITVLKSGLGGNLLGFADTYVTNLGDSDFDGDLNGVPVSDRVRIDDRAGPGEVAFWVDPTPNDNSEFLPGKNTVGLRLQALTKRQPENTILFGQVTK
ncbi:MAG: hypothetical protein GWP14_08950 [Actinobacteria bacterium]|nr:hypothetical protein [Actinomycetota bacterium]